MQLVYNGTKVSASRRSILAFLAMEQDPEKLSVAETLKILDVSRQTLYVLIKDGRITPLPGNPLKKKEPRYFRRSDVLALRPDKHPPSS